MGGGANGTELARWSGGEGEMAGRIRAFDWSATPLGPIEGWPQSLKTAVDTCLGSGFASYVWWGPDLVQVYNDAALDIVRAKHPAALGAPARETWSDVWDVVGPLAERVVGTGDPVLCEDMPMVPERGGPREAAYFTFSYSALRDEAGDVAGMFITAIETTEKVREAVGRREREERQAYLLKLSDALRPLDHPQAIQHEAMRVLGEQLGASRAAYFETDGDEYVIDSDHARGVPSLAGRHVVEAFGREALERHRNGRPSIVPDVAEVHSEAEQQSLAAAQVGAYIVVPLAKEGRFVAGLTVHSVTPRAWTPAEVAVVEETAERTWAAVERARAEAALRESEERYRTLVENVGGHAIFMLDAGGVVTGWTESAERVKGYAAEEVLGRHVSMFYAPEEITAGEPERELAHAAEEGRAEREAWRVHKDGKKIWVNEIATAVRDDAGELVGFTKISRDLTGRRRVEAALRESEERYRLAADAAGLGRWEFTPGTGELVGDDVWEGHHGAAPDSEMDLEGHLAAIHPDDREEVRRRVEGAVNERENYEAEYRVPLPDGSTRFMLSRGRFVRGVGSAPERLVGVTLDVTEGRELQSERERALTRELIVLAEAAERERISRELHDRVAHHMGVAHQSLELHAALAGSAPDRAAERLELARETTRRALDQTRALSAELKRLQNEELDGGLEAAFGALAESYVPEGVEVDLSFSGDESAIPDPVGLQFYLAMREAIRNAVRHSGCSRIGITLGVRDGEVMGRVEDDGRGFDPAAVASTTPSWGVGLRSMRERAEMLGGSVSVDSEPGMGTSVEVRVPRRP